MKRREASVVPRTVSAALQMRALGLALLLPPLLRLRGLGGLDRLLQRAGRVSARAGVAAVRARCRTALARLPWITSCLVRAAAEAYLLRRAGHDARVAIGATLVEGRLGSHAWVVVGASEADRNDIGRLDREYGSAGEGAAPVAEGGELLPTCPPPGFVEMTRIPS